MIFKSCITVPLIIKNSGTQNEQTAPLNLSFASLSVCKYTEKLLKHKQSIKKHQDFQLWHMQVTNYEHTHLNYNINSIINEVVYKFLFLDNCYQFWTTQMLRQHWNTVLFLVNWLLMQQNTQISDFFWMCSMLVINFLAKTLCGKWKFKKWKGIYFLHTDFSHWFLCGYHVLNTTNLIHENNTQQKAQHIK
jgi:hypothetical protein